MKQNEIAVTLYTVRDFCQTEKDLLNTFISLESLYATMVRNNVTTDIVPDLQDKEYIQNVYDGIEKLKKEIEKLKLSSNN